MSDIVTTPTKSYLRKNKKKGSSKEQCRLCGKSDGQLQQIFSGVGRTKNLQEKIVKSCGIALSFQDQYSKSVCSRCERFLDKIWVFRETCQKIQDVQQDVDRPTVVVQKRCAKDSNSSGGKNSSHKRLKFQNNANNTTDVVKENLPQSQLKALDLSSSTSLAKFLMESCPNTVQELKQIILNDVEKKANDLCTRGQGSSILFHKDFDALANLNFDSIYEEFSENFPFVCQIMTVMSSKKKINTNDLMPKFSFIYSVMMNSRWHELSCLKRVMTILLVEGECSKKVRVSFFC